MTDVLAPIPAEELIADLNVRIRAMFDEMHKDIEREEGRLKQYRRDRHRRFEDETRHMAAQRDGLIQALANAVAEKPPIFLGGQHYIKPE